VVEHSNDDFPLPLRLYFQLLFFKKKNSKSQCKNLHQFFSLCMSHYKERKIALTRSEN
jgi:hypothetical protein